MEIGVPDVFHDALVCKFLSGNRRCMNILWWDGKNASQLMTEQGTCIDKLPSLISILSAFQMIPVGICGPVIHMPDKISELCCLIPSSSVFVSPVFGEDVQIEKNPRRKDLFHPNAELIDAPFQEFDPQLNGDGLGRMADLVAKGVAVRNEMKSGVGISPFYNRVLHDGSYGSGIYLVLTGDMDRLFPHEPISSKAYAASCVPVRMKVTEEFRKMTGCVVEYADVYVVSDLNPDAMTFMRFYNVMSRGRTHVVSSPISKKTIPTFRYDRAYRVEN